ncbi:hypothetical protein MNBD_GAMMA23-1811 [hydrothermal vent metagenome]|uniref:Uncharacterized protein n=1 Tax=hydrothermal vent metagenome TaxID=652676 RepID=A0A3B0ZUQ7_9ZZZZ
MKNLLLVIIILFTSELFACEKSSDFQAGFLGSIISPDSSINSALIKLEASEADWFYEGDVIKKGYVLNKIQKDYILVQNVNKHFKIYLNSCEPLVEIDNPYLYLAATDVDEPSETNEGLTNTELTAQQQRIFLKAPVAKNGHAESRTQELEHPVELKKDQTRVFHEMVEQKEERKNAEPDY